MKRLNAPKHWMLAKMGGVWAPKPVAGPHKQRECLPLSIILRNRLKYALTRKESMMICMQKKVEVDGKVRTELNFPAGFMGECGAGRPEPVTVVLALAAPLLLHMLRSFTSPSFCTPAAHLPPHP